MRNILDKDEAVEKVEILVLIRETFIDFLWTRTKIFKQQHDNINIRVGT